MIYQEINGKSDLSSVQHKGEKTSDNCPKRISRLKCTTPFLRENFKYDCAHPFLTGRLWLLSHILNEIRLCGDISVNNISDPYGDVIKIFYTVVTHTLSESVVWGPRDCPEYSDN